jgi:hypothetical protein
VQGLQSNSEMTIALPPGSVVVVLQDPARSL